jgi:hypothetical protein
VEAFFEWIHATVVATTVRDSLLLTGGLSAIHLLGMTLITGGALVSNLRLLGALLASDDLLTVTRAAARGIALGLSISVPSGLLLFSARATEASVNPTFRIKMLLLASAAVFQFAVHSRVCRHVRNRPAQRVTGAVALSLWVGVAAAGAYYILLGE